MTMMTCTNCEGSGIRNAMECETCVGWGVIIIFPKFVTFDDVATEYDKMLDDSVGNALRQSNLFGNYGPVGGEEDKDPDGG